MFETLPEKAWGKSRNIFSLWGLPTPTPLDRMNPKSVRYNYIHPWACLWNFVPIAQYLREVMARRTHSPRPGRRRRRRRKKTKEVRIIFWRAMFGVEYLENLEREKFEIFWIRSRVSIFWYAEKWGSWLESFRSKKIAKDPNRAVTEADPKSWTT